MAPIIERCRGVRGAQQNVDARSPVASDCRDAGLYAATRVFAQRGKPMETSHEESLCVEQGGPSRGATWLW